MSTLKNLVGVLLFLMFSCSEKSKVIVLNSYPNGGDTVISYPKTVNNYGTEKEINIYCDTINGNKSINRGLFLFPLKELSFKRIDSVFLHLHFNENSGFYSFKEKGHSGDLSLIVEQILVPWDENRMNWKQYPKVGQEKVFFKPSADSHQDFRINVSSLFPSNLDTPKTHYGLLVRLQNEEPGNYVHVVSKEHPNKEQTPTLKIYAKE